jgi:hypothetical protein
MWDTRSVQVSVRLPSDVAAEVKEVEQSDPDFLSRVVLYGLTRRSVYRRLSESEVEDDREGRDEGDGDIVSIS